MHVNYKRIICGNAWIQSMRFFMWVSDNWF